MNNPALPLTIPYEAIAAFCQRNHIRKLALFGSVLRDDFRPDSDIDVLMEFEPGHARRVFQIYRSANRDC
jgi:uncharacterized protein